MRDSRPRVRVGISPCLLGQEVRYDGGHKRDGRITEAQGKFFEWVPVCPEERLFSYHRGRDRRPAGRT